MHDKMNEVKSPLKEEYIRHARLLLHLSKS